MSLISGELADSLFDRAADAFGIGDQQVVAHDLDFVAQFFGHQFPGFPVVLSQAVFDGDDGIIFHPLGPEINHLLAAQVSCLPCAGCKSWFSRHRIRRQPGRAQWQHLAATGFEASL